MRWTALIALLIVIYLHFEAGATPPVSSPQSRQVIARQRPGLEKALAARGLEWGARLYIRIFKAEKSLEVWLYRRHRFELYKSYPICTYGGKGLGPKTRQGDGRAPEGFYTVAPRQMNPFSRYHLAFNLGYPNAYDCFYGHTGSALMVHGQCVSIGCFAMTDTAIEEIYSLADAAFRNGQPFFRVHIFPFRMTAKRLQQYRHSPWAKFWWNLKEGYDWFGEHNRVAPNVIVHEGRYLFEAATETRSRP